MRRTNENDHKGDKTFTCGISVQHSVKKKTEQQ